MPQISSLGNCTHNFQLQVVVGSSRMAVDPDEHGVEARRDESEREDVPARVRTLVRRIPEVDRAALQAPLVGYGLWKRSRLVYGVVSFCPFEAIQVDFVKLKEMSFLRGRNVMASTRVSSGFYVTLKSSIEFIYFL